MTCDEAREQFSAWLDGALTREDHDALGAHLHVCPECRRELTRLEQTVSLLRAIEPARAPAGFVDRVVGAARRAPWYRRLLRRLFWPLEVKLPLEAAAVVLVGVTALYLYQQSPELKLATRVEAPPPPAAVRPPDPPAGPAPKDRATQAEQASPYATTAPAEEPTAAGRPAAAEKQAAAEKPVPSGVDQERQAQLGSKTERSEPPPRVAGPLQDAPPAAASPDPPGRRDAGEADAIGPAARAKEAAPAEEGRAPGQAAGPSSTSEAKSRASAAPPPPPSTPSSDVRGAEPHMERPQTREETAKASRAPLAAAPPAGQTFRSAATPTPAHVSGQLRVSDRAAALRGIAELVARLGGVQISPPGQAGAAAGEVVEVAVPRAAYRDLADGLARLGQWRPEREPAELPPTVRVALRLLD